MHHRIRPMSSLAGPCTLCKISSISVARAQRAVLKCTFLPLTYLQGSHFPSLFSGFFLTEFLPACHWADALNWLHTEVGFEETDICFHPLKVLANDAFDANSLPFSLSSVQSDPLVILLQPTNRWKYQLCKLTQASATSLAAAGIHFAKGTTAFPEHYAHLASCPDSSLPDQKERADRTAAHLEMNCGHG